MVLTKVAHNDAKSLKKIGCIFPHHLGGGGVRPWCGKFHKIFIFLTLYPSLSIVSTPHLPSGSRVVTNSNRQTAEEGGGA